VQVFRQPSGEIMGQPPRIAESRLVDQLKIDIAS
jgi:hypothetical protein